MTFQHISGNFVASYLGREIGGTLLPVLFVKPPPVLSLLLSLHPPVLLSKCHSAGLPVAPLRRSFSSHLETLIAVLTALGGQYAAHNYRLASHLAYPPPPTTPHLLSPPPKLTVTVASLPTPLLIYRPLCPRLSHHFPSHLQPHSSVSGVGGLDSLPFQTRRRGSSLSTSFIPLSILHSFFSQFTSLASDEGVRSAAIDLRRGLTQLQCVCVSGASRRTPKRASTHAA